MSLPRPVMHDGESPVIPTSTPSSEPGGQSTQEIDSPPKYDSLEDEDTRELPDYQEAVAGQQMTDK